MAEHALDKDEGTGLLKRWQQTEPLRLWLYGIAVPLMALLIGYGYLTEGRAGLWLAVIAAALLSGGTEVARLHVTPPATVRAAVQDAAATWTREGGPVDKHDAAHARAVLIRYRIPS